jgi:AraC-like protein
MIRQPPSPLPRPTSSGVIRAVEPNGLATVKFSTDDVPEKQRVALWRDYYAQVVFKVEIEPAKELPFEAHAISRILPGLHLLRSIISTARVARTPRFIADGSDEFTLIINRTRDAMVSARGREMLLASGDAVLLNCDETATFDRACLGDSVSLRVPHRILSSLVGDIENSVMRPIQQNSADLKLLTSYVATLVDENLLEAPELRQTIVNHVHGGRPWCRDTGKTS